MKERPILCCGPMVRAIIEDRKTHTRRLIKPQPECFSHADWPDSPDFRPSFNSDGSLCCGVCMGKHQRLTRTDVTGIRNPYGQPGDRLWVKETHMRVHPAMLNGLDPGPNSRYWETLYRADGVDSSPYTSERGFKWKPSIFMPRTASRITLEITSIRAERLQYITWQDAIREGIEELPSPTSVTRWRDYSRNIPWLSNPIDSFRTLWDSINGKKAPWQSNPWVWVIEFRRLKP